MFWHDWEGEDGGGGEGEDDQDGLELHFFSFLAVDVWWWWGGLVEVGVCCGIRRRGVDVLVGC